MNPNYILKIVLAQTDEAGPLWLLLESVLELVWVRVAILSFVVIAILVALAYAIRRKS
jgi:hypothetical protein